MRRDSSAMWVYALAAALLATAAVARSAPERVDSAVLDASRPIADPIPYEGWWNDRVQ